MKPNSGESTAAFVLRVHIDRKMHDIKEDFTCYLVFSQHFSPEFATKCESVKLNMSVQPSKHLIRTKPTFGWPSIIAIAKEELHGWKLQ